MIILLNGNIYTLDDRIPRASALVIENGRIVDLGDTSNIQATYASGGLWSDIQAGENDSKPVKLINLEGRTVIPGLVDAHIHLSQYALGMNKVDCETDTITECLERVRARASQTPPGKWILGHGWNQNNWQAGFGNADELDQVAPGNPVYLTAKSLHAGWANHMALHQAGISVNTPDPVDGRISRDAHGNPDGILFEGAMTLMDRVIPEATDEEIQNAIIQVQPVLWRMGLTGLHDFDRKRCFVALQNIKANGQLRLRVVKSIPWEDLEHAAALGFRTGFGDYFLRIGSIKAFADGALGPRTAAMLQPYEGEPGNTGMLVLDAEELFEKGRLAVENGLSLAVHAIGDRANHAVLDAFDHLRQYEAPHVHADQKPTSSNQLLRHRIEHVQLIHPEDAGRLAQLHIIASMQPIHATSDMHMADKYWGRRSANAYAWKTQLQHGAILAFGSDAPVESPNPFWGLHAAVTRRRADGTPGENGWYPEQSLNLKEALRAFTTGPAYAANMENHLGKLSPGYLADLLVLNADPFKIDPMEIKDISPLATMINGAWVSTV